MSIIYIIGVNAHEYMRKEMMGKWIALLTCIINLKGNNTSATHKNIIPPYVSFHIVLENMLFYVNLLDITDQCLIFFLR